MTLKQQLLEGKLTLTGYCLALYCKEHGIEDVRMPIAPSYYINWLENKLWELECEIATLKKESQG